MTTYIPLLKRMNMRVHETDLVLPFCLDSKVTPVRKPSYALWLNDNSGNRSYTTAQPCTTHFL